MAIRIALVTGAGVGMNAQGTNPAFQEVTIEEWVLFHFLNLTVPFLLAQSSAAYASSKAGLVGLTRHLAGMGLNQGQPPIRSRQDGSQHLRALNTKKQHFRTILPLRRQVGRAIRMKSRQRFRSSVGFGRLHDRRNSQCERARVYRLTSKRPAPLLPAIPTMARSAFASKQDIDACISEQWSLTGLYTFSACTEPVRVVV